MPTEPGPAVPARPDADPLDASDAGAGMPDELVVAFMPRQILGGFVLLAAIIALLLRRTRRGRR